MQSYNALGNKPNDTSNGSRPDIPDDAQTAFCPQCDRELRGHGIYENGSTSFKWWCAVHRYVDQPQFDGGSR